MHLESSVPGLDTLSTPSRRLRGGLYVRYSSRYQHPIKDQFRICLEWAERNNVSIQGGHCFRDKAVSLRHRERHHSGVLSIGAEPPNGRFT